MQKIAIIMLLAISKEIKKHNYIYTYAFCCLSEEGAKNFSWPWLSPLRGRASLTITFLGKFK